MLSDLTGKQECGQEEEKCQYKNSYNHEFLLCFVYFSCCFEKAIIFSGSGTPENPVNIFR